MTLYPLHLRIAAYLGGRSGLAATLLALLGIALLVVAIALLMSSLGDFIRTLIEAVQQSTLQIPAPPEAVAAWPVIGEEAPRRVEPGVRLRCELLPELLVVTLSGNIFRTA